MAIRCLTPHDINCEFSSNCTKICYNNCSRCSNNKLAIEKWKKESQKKNYFKLIRKADLR